jgi:hypothetical protein
MSMFGMAGKVFGQTLRQVFTQRRGVAQKANLAFEALGVLGEIGLQMFDLLQDQPRMLRKRFACCGRG